MNTKKISHSAIKLLSNALNRLTAHFGLGDKLLLSFVAAALFTLAVALIGWFSFQTVVSTQRTIINEAIPAMNMIQELARANTRIFSTVPQLGNSENIDQVKSLKDIFLSHISQMDSLLQNLEEISFQDELRIKLTDSVTRIEDNLNQQAEQISLRLQLIQKERAIFSEGHQAATELVDLSESLIANASMASTAIISSLYSTIENTDTDRREVFEVLDHLVEVDLDKMERMSELQLTCFNLKAQLDQLDSENRKSSISNIQAIFISNLKIIDRRIKDIADPSRRKNAENNYKILNRAIDANGIFYTRLQRVEVDHLLKKIRNRGIQFVHQLNEQAGEMLKAGRQSIDLSSAEAERAVDTGIWGYLIVASLLLLALVSTLWVLLRYRVVNRLHAMESAVHAITTGDYDVEIVTTGGDKLATLGRALDKLRENARVRNRLEQQLLHHQQELEQQVEQRTIELQHSNALLAHEAKEHEIARQSAEEASRVKTNFLATVSHELRTPLSGVLGTLQLLSDTGLQKRQWEYVKMIRSANSTLLDILDDMLGYSQLEAGKLNIVLSSFLLRETIDSMLSLQAVRANAKGIALVREIDDSVPEKLTGDRRKITQILLNLIGNAVKFTDEGSVTVSVSVKKVKGDNIVLKFFISDTGIGIPETQIEHVLKPFYQVDDANHRRHGGTGLGLAICRRLVEAMGGNINVSSQINEGSTVSFTLALEVSTQLLEHEMTDQAPLSQSSKAKPLNVLVVEDDDINRMVCIRYLESLGHTVIESSDGIQALVKLQNCDEPVDVIMMDISLPGASGLEVAVEIRSLPGERWEKTPIIAMSAHVFSNAVDSYYAAGMAEFLSKPFDRNQLDAALRKVVGEQTKNNNSTTTDTESNLPFINAGNNLLDEDYLSGELDSLGIETLSELKELFVIEFKSFSELFNQARYEKDWNTLSKQAHRLKSAAGNLGLSQTIARAQQLEKTASSSSVDEAKIDYLLSKLNDECWDSIKVLVEWLKSNKN